MGIGPRIGLREVVRQGDGGICEVDGLAILQAIFSINSDASRIRRRRARCYSIVLVVANNPLIGDVAILALGLDVEVQVLTVNRQGMRAIYQLVVVISIVQQVVMAIGRIRDSNLAVLVLRIVISLGNIESMNSIIIVGKLCRQIISRPLIDSGVLVDFRGIFAIAFNFLELFLYPFRIQDAFIIICYKAVEIQIVGAIL